MDFQPRLFAHQRPTSRKTRLEDDKGEEAERQLYPSRLQDRPGRLANNFPRMKKSYPHPIRSAVRSATSLDLDPIHMRGVIVLILVADLARATIPCASRFSPPMLSYAMR
jgi:hypothetical protein